MIIFKDKVKTKKMDLANMWKVKKLEVTAHLDHPDIMTKRQMQWQPRTLYKWISGYPSC